MLPAAGTVEEKILQLQQWKQQLIEGVMADGRQAFPEMKPPSAKELDFLLDRSNTTAAHVLGKPDLLASAA